MSNTINYPAKFEPWFEPYRYKIARGGRGSGKSWSVIAAAVENAITFNPGEVVVCCRWIQKSLATSSFPLIKSTIYKLGLQDHYEVGRNFIRTKYGVDFVFEGLSTNLDNIKSMEGIRLMIIEEADKVDQNSYNVAFPSVRAKNSEIHIVYNPTKHNDAIHQMVNDGFFGENHQDYLLLDLNYDDNPWFPDVLETDRKRDKEKLPKELYDHIWEGATLENIESALIKPNFFGYYEKLPSAIDSVIIIDTATQAHEHNDNTALLFGGKDQHGYIYLIDMLVTKATSNGRELATRQFWKKHHRRLNYGIGAKELFIEQQGSGYDLIQRLENSNSQYRLEKAHMGVIGQTGDYYSKIINVGKTPKPPGKGLSTSFNAKFRRFLDVERVVSSGDILLPKNPIFYNDFQVTDADWVEGFLDECTAFTFDDTHEHDDQVDCLIDIAYYFADNSSVSPGISKAFGMG